jgi:hypothetical protein
MTITARAIRIATTAAAAGVVATAVVAPAGTAVASNAVVAGHDVLAPGLEHRASADGVVPVIVELDVATTATFVTNGSEQSAIVHARKNVLNELGGRPAALKTSKTMPLLAFQATPQELAALQSSDAVSSVVFDGEVAAEATSWNGQAGGQQLAQQWDYSRIRANTANNNGYKGAGQYIAVIDSGVASGNPYLAGDVGYEACFSTTSPGTGSTAGQCPNGTNSQYGTGAARPCSYAYICAHGTHVAHTAAGQYGVAPAARIIAVNASHRGTDKYGNAAPYYYYSDIVWGLNYVYNLRVNYGVNVAAVNLSVGGGGYTTYCDGAVSDGTVANGLVGQWFDALRNKGIAPVVSSGNDGYRDGVSAPGCYRSAITVGNTTVTTDGADAVYGSSNSDDTVDLLAPGTDICSAVPANLDNDGSANGWQCGWIGTSMAAPQVTGAIAVLRGYWNGATVNQLERALKESGVSVSDGYATTRTRIDVWSALNRLYQISRGA